MFEVTVNLALQQSMQLGLVVTAVEVERKGEEASPRLMATLFLCALGWSPSFLTSGFTRLSKSPRT